ncbi:YfgM family protein [Arenimonas sp. MALMAid1274]|uniref:YfgM family protein n=1 Tax=Arenimonas sp. MALMAid1274 TaxID=3411630 RepID=UPI003BA1266C
MDQIDEYEQGERVRAWLRSNGSSLIGGIALGLACLGGWQWWQGQQGRQQLEAANEYHAYTKAADAKEEAKASAHFAALGKDYADTPYPALAALRQAADLHAQGKDDEAIKALESVKGEGVDPMLAELAQLRIARLLTGQGKHEDAIKRVSAIANPAYPAVAAEIRGDAEMALGRREQARDEYEKALASMDIAAPTRPMVEMKLTDAGGSPNAQPET